RSGATADGWVFFARSGSGQEIQRPRHDDFGGVLQGRSWSLEFAHHWADAHYLRFLPALLEASRGTTVTGHGTQGASLRQPECDRQRSWHGARLTGGVARQRTGHGRSAFP